MDFNVVLHAKNSLEVLRMSVNVCEVASDRVSRRIPRRGFLQGAAVVEGTTARPRLGSARPPASYLVPPEPGYEGRLGALLVQLCQLHIMRGGVGRDARVGREPPEAAAVRECELGERDA